MTEPRMDGSLEQKLLWRISALREALTEVQTCMVHGSAYHIAGNALNVDSDNAKLCGASMVTSQDRGAL